MRFFALLVTLFVSFPALAQQQQQAIQAVICDTPEQIKQLVTSVENDKKELMTAVQEINAQAKVAACAPVVFQGSVDEKVETFQVKTGEITILKVTVVRVLDQQSHQWQQLKQPDTQYTAMLKKSEDI